jgi:hypothetical protein
MKLAAGGAEETIDIPHRKADELFELLETLYVLYGWSAVDGVFERIQRSFIAAVGKILGIPPYELQAFEVLLPSDEPLYVPKDHVELAKKAVESLRRRADKRPWPRVMAGLGAVVPANGMFSSDAPQAETHADIAANPEVAARLFADVLVAVSAARAEVQHDVLDALMRTELETRRLITSMLTDSRAGVVREALRYFAFADEMSAGEILTHLHSLGVPADKTRKPGKSGLRASDPDALQAALRQLVPFVREIVKVKGAPRPGTAIRRMVEAEEARRRVTYAHELGRFAQDFPILSQIAPEDVEPASTASPSLLGDYLFPLLKQTYEANVGMRARVETFPILTRSEAVTGDRHPDRRLAQEVEKLGHDKTVWGFPKYVQRSLSRVAGPSDDFTRRAVSDTLAAIQSGNREVAMGIAQAAGEMLVMETTSHLIPRFLPALNVLLAAWHITVAVREHIKRTEEFFCALDPRDSLIEAAPSTVGLVFEVGMEAAFAFI